MEQVRRFFVKVNGGFGVNAWLRPDGKFIDADSNEIKNVLNHAYIQCADMTIDQFHFERELKKYTNRGDYSKNYRRMYKDNFMASIYKVWREAKGLPVDDPGYYEFSEEDQKKLESWVDSPVYNKGKIKGD